VVAGVAAALFLGTAVFLTLWWRRAAKKKPGAFYKGVFSISVFSLSFSARTKANIESVARASDKLDSGKTKGTSNLDTGSEAVVTEPTDTKRV
jgi:hypothetical protein